MSDRSCARPPHPPRGVAAVSARLAAKAVALGSVVLPAEAQSPPSLERLTLERAAAADDFLGRSVATDGSRIAAGVPEHDLPGIGGAGAVAIFERVSGAWLRTALLVADDAAVADVLGESVALDGDLLIASAANVGLLSPAPWTGAAYVFERSAKGWLQRAKLIPADPSEFLEAGLASDIDAPSRTAVVGARLDDDLAPDAGSASVYREVNGVWVLEQELHAPDAAPGDAFGYRVAIDGDIVAVATPATDALAESTGSVYVFERGAGGFAFRAKLMASDAAFRDRFGFAVDVDASRGLIAVGAVGDDNGDAPGDQGAAYLFGRIDGDWTELAKLVASDRAPLDAFGSSVAVDGGRLLVGARAASVGAPGTGAAYLFEERAGTWTEVRKFVSATGGANDALGGSVALRGTVAVLGAEAHDFPLANAGAAFVADLPSACPADLDGDGRVDAVDLGAVLGAWGPCRTGCGADFDGDGLVDASDLAVVLGSWGDCG